MKKTFLFVLLLPVSAGLLQAQTIPGLGNGHISDLNPLGGRAERLHPRSVVTTLV